MWSAFGAYDWDSLLTRQRGHYESGAFDARLPFPRPTALASVAHEIASGKPISHPLARRDGWWRRPTRLTYPPSGPRAVGSASEHPIAPLVVVGSGGTLGSAIVRACLARSIPVVSLRRADLDATDSQAIESILERLRPWAVVNCAGYVRVDDAERDAEACHRVNVVAPLLLARACARSGLRFVTFSSDLVFDGRLSRPYAETDATGPLSVYGASKAQAERLVLDALPQALVVRTSAFFGPLDDSNFVTRTLTALAAGQEVAAPEDAVVSPTYVPDLAHSVLTLLVDGASGVYHVANTDALTWYALARLAAERTGTRAFRLRPCTMAEFSLAARRPRFSALRSERAALMPPLADAVARYCLERRAL
jgi:dTDP-4-dehydrorhamnose reductase